MRSAAEVDSSAVLGTSLWEIVEARFMEPRFMEPMEAVSSLRAEPRTEDVVEAITVEAKCINNPMFTML